MAFVPFLKGLNLPTNEFAAIPFVWRMAFDGVTDAVLSVYKPSNMQGALVNFFNSSGVQDAFQAAVAGNG